MVEISTALDLRRAPTSRRQREPSREGDIVYPVCGELIYDDSLKILARRAWFGAEISSLARGVQPFRTDFITVAVIGNSLTSS